jgi:hypothetical protein
VVVFNDPVNPALQAVLMALVKVEPVGEFEPLQLQPGVV